jgi:hypothetical protein
VDATELRKTANDVGRAAAHLTERSFADGRAFEALTADLSTLREAADICRRLARREEAQKATGDPKAPLCLGCKHRMDSPSALACGLAMDTKAAAAKGNCNRYEAEL